MNKRTAKIIRDSKRWGEWAESVFAVRAAENGLPVSKPFGESGSFDCVVGRPGKFVAVQGEVHAGRDAERERIGLFGEEQQQEIPGRGLRFSGGVCNTAGCVVHRSGEVDLRASVDLFVHDGQRRKYEEYREAWHLLRKASGCEEAAEGPMSEPEETPMGPGMARMQAAMNSFRNYLEKGGRAPR